MAPRYSLVTADSSNAPLPHPAPAPAGFASRAPWPGSNPGPFASPSAANGPTSRPRPTAAPQRHADWPCPAPCPGGPRPASACVSPGCARAVLVPWNRTARGRGGPLTETGPVNTPFSPAALAHLHATFLTQVLPRVERHGRVYFRHVKCPDRKEELL